jgi:hypothetical protein
MYSQYEIFKTPVENNRMLKKSFFLALALSMASIFILSLPGCGGGGGTVTIAPSTAKAMTSFSFVGYTGAAGVIDETAKTIAVTVPFGTDVTGLVATFTSTGVSVKVGSTVQTSAATANNFSSPVSYTVTAADTTAATYIVTVSVSLYVDPATGSDANTGTQASPFKTISWAINAASAVAAINGADIHAASGVYSTVANGEAFPLMPTTGEHLIGPVIGSGTANIDGAGSYTIFAGELPAAISIGNANPISTTIVFAPGVTGSVSGITANGSALNVIVADNATVTLSNNTITLPTGCAPWCNTVPVWIVNGSVATLTSNTITGYVSVDVADGSTKVLARNNHFGGSYGVVTADSGLLHASQLDLGTAASPGNNTIQCTLIGVSNSGQAGDAGVTAVGNTWNPVQNADLTGHYAAQYITGPTPTVAGPNNYYVFPTAGIQF